MNFASVKKILLWVLFLIVFFFFFRVDIIPSGNHTKLSVRTREGGNGFVLRMSWKGPEIWEVKHTAEIKKLFPQHFDPVKKLEKYTE